jgi:DNA polymerase I
MYEQKCGDDIAGPGGGPPGAEPNKPMKRLFLLDGMALVYRAHFAFMSRPIFTSRGVNTSALYGFTQTLLDIVKNQQPTHIGVAFDTEAPTHRHKEFADYKATRQVMPEDLSRALPHVRRMIEAFNIPVITCDGFEADDIIGTLVRRAQKEGFESYMVTPDKDFGQLVDANTFIYKPSRMGEGVEIMGVPEVRRRWGIERPEQVVDILALMGDSSDNIPGVAGVGEKTAVKLIAQYGSVENLLAHAGELTGRAKSALSAGRDQAMASKRLATILCEAPCQIDLESLKLRPADEPRLRELLVEFEFNSIGRRLFGEDFKAGRGYASPVPPAEKAVSGRAQETQELPLLETRPPSAPASAPPVTAGLKTLADVPHEYQVAASDAERAMLIRLLREQTLFGFHADATGVDSREDRLLGLAFSFKPHCGFYVSMPAEPAEAARLLEQFRAVLESNDIEKVGHDLKHDLGLLRQRGLEVGGKLFDTMIAHSLVEPDMRHSLGYLSEAYLGYTPLQEARGRVQSSLFPAGTEGGVAEQGAGLTPTLEAQPALAGLGDVPGDPGISRATENADLALQLRAALEPLLKEKAQQRVFFEIESPLIPVLVSMEYEGIKVDAAALAEFGLQLAKEMSESEKAICRLAGTTFNLNSPRQLGQILFDVLKICEAPKKTKTGQYATDEQTLLALAPDHEIVQRLLEYRTAAKLKSTYADALPNAIWAKTGRIHTTFNQVATATGRLNSQNPNLQNIPIRTERGQEIRRAFVPRDPDHLLLSADYSQIELRIIAALSHEGGLLEAFKAGLDVHTATAARVYGVSLEEVSSEMRRKAKMVNYGIAYGISPFGLAQRLGIPRKEAGDIIDQYFRQFPGIRKFMDSTIAFAREHGYVETVSGRRRYIRDIRSANNTVRAGAERNAINAPIQGTAADMIKIAMVNIQRELIHRGLRTRMLLQVHDELVFDLLRPEEAEVRRLVEDKMQTALPLEVPIVVEIGTGQNWLEAH